jgi:hypothetical protein
MAKNEGRWQGIIKNVKKQLGILRNQGISPTLRTMHYRLVSLGVIGNTKNEYKELSRQTAHAREDGILPINCFVDQSREVYDNEYRDDSDLSEPEDHVDDVISELENLDKDYVDLDLPQWYNQKHYVEIWLEKDALLSTFVRYIEDPKVRIVPNKGYSSLPFLYDNSRRLRMIARDERKQIHIRYFGDFDPSGSDMDRDIEERLAMLGVPSVDFERVAVKREHVEEYGLPPMPSDAESIRKFHNDPRTRGFVTEQGGQFAVELDALTVYAPDAFKQMIQDCVKKFYKKSVYDREVKKRSTPEFKREIKQMIRDKVQGFLDNYDVDAVADSNTDNDDDNPDLSEDELTEDDDLSEDYNLDYNAAP